MTTRATRAPATVAGALLASALVVAAATSALELPPQESRLRLRPPHLRVFAGASYRFHAAQTGARTPISWSVVGDGTIDATGIYTAPAIAGSAVVVARSARSAASASIDVVPPPAADLPLVFVTCFEDGDVRAFSALDFREAGAYAIPAKAGGIAADAVARRVVVAGGERVFAFDAASMGMHASAAVRGARFSEVAALAGGFMAATDNEADARHWGVRIFHIGHDGVPNLAFSIAAGETPEGIAPARGGREFYVTSVNSAELRRFTFDPVRGPRSIAVTRTGNRPFGVAVDETHRAVFVADNDTAIISGSHARPALEAFDAGDLHRLAPLRATGSTQSLPLGLAVDERRRRLFVTNEGDRSLAVYALPSLRRLATLETGRLPWLPAIDSSGAAIIVPEAGADAFEVFDARSLARKAGPIAACGYPTSAAYLPAAVPTRR